MSCPLNNVEKEIEMATCPEIETQLVSLMQESEGLASDMKNIKSQMAEIAKQAGHPFGNDELLKELQDQLVADDAELKRVKAKIAALRRELRVCRTQPQHILDISYTNPEHPKQIDGLFAQTVAFGKQDPTSVLGGTFPSLDA
ncbi:hypothetical protein KDA23_02395, partial [Candidatus Saccharibacteria bacterium]|nr:hypothetical protein [Candidatus Saccharibacteria bacterium]